MSPLKSQYIPFARKYRPADFSQLMGQEVLTKTLSQCIAHDRLFQAYLLTGIRGIGKTSSARIIAKTINCTEPKFTNEIALPCNECSNCSSFTAHNHPDIIELDAASRTSIDDIREIIESSSDKVIWCSEEGDINPAREQDSFFKGTIIEGIKNYVGQNKDLKQINKIITAGSPEMMQGIRDARKTFLKEYLNGHEAVANINSPMQCMMKAVCARCLLRNVDPETGKEKFVYSCECQEQKLDEIDFSNLEERLEMNAPMEKLNRLYYECFVK